MVFKEDSKKEERWYREVYFQLNQEEQLTNKIKRHLGKQQK